MRPPLRFAVVGCGRMGQLHSEQLRQDGRGRVVALADADRAAAERLRDALALDAAVFDDLDTLLCDAPVDAAIVCTPTRAHFDQATACLDRGVHVLCEKPLADAPERIAPLVERGRRGPARLAVAYQRRSWAAFRLLRDEVQSGRWGPIRAVTSVNVENWQQTIGGTWRDDPATNPGGFIRDAGSHKIDMLFFVTGLSPVEVSARCDTCGSRVEITATVSATLTGGVPLAMAFVGHAAHLGEDLHIHCERADWMFRHGEVWRAERGRLERIPVTQADSSPVADFLSMLLDGTANVAPAECAVPVDRFTRGILESSRTGRLVRLDQNP